MSCTPTSPTSLSQTITVELLAAGKYKTIGEAELINTNVMNEVPTTTTDITKTKNNNLNGFGGKKVNVSKRVITLEEIAQHNTEEDAWVGFRGKVYNLTPYIHFHPGGAKILEQAFGTDCTALFDKFHKYVNGEFMMRECQVGVMPGFVNDDEEDEDDDDF